MNASGPAPSGILTFLFSDVEGSTKLLQSLGNAYVGVLEEHRRMLREAFTAHGGVEVGTEGDSFFVAFEKPSSALAAALDGQRALEGHAWPEGAKVRVRMGLHAGEATRVGDDYHGLAVHVAARISAAAHGGQILLSRAIANLGAPPEGATLRDLGEHGLRDLGSPENLLQMLHPDLQADFPAPRTLSVLPHNLPLQPTPLVGREAEIAELREIVRANRAVTLTGTGGVGKTRLALQAGAELLPYHPGGVWVADLASLGDASLVPNAVASAVGVREEASRSIQDSLAAGLRDKELLLVLDNCEHLIEPCARLVDRILRSAAGVKVIATSRESLRIAGEVVWPVPPMGLPPEGAGLDEVGSSPAVQLFLEAARRASPGFAPASDDLADVARVCASLDGIPLAIELAAARVRVMNAREIVERLDDRLRMLTGGARTAEPRQRTLAATIAWSYDLLSDEERDLFERLGVFAGPFALESAEAVCTDDGLDAYALLDLLTALVDKSLVSAEPGEATTYRLLESVRNFSRERLADRIPSLRARLLGLAEDLATRAAAGLRGPEGSIWLRRLQHEHDNLRAALEYALAPGGDAAAALRVAASLSQFWLQRGYLTEGRGWLERALAAAPAEEPARGTALVGAGALAWSQGDDVRAEGLIGAGLELFRATGNRRGEAMALSNMGINAARTGDLASAEAQFSDSLAIYRELDDRRGIAGALTNLGALAAMRGDADGAARLYGESLSATRALGDRWGEANALANLADLAIEGGRDDEARQEMGEALAIFRELGDRQRVAGALLDLGAIAERGGDHAGARTMIEEALTLGRTLADPAVVERATHALAGLAPSDGSH